MANLTASDPPNDGGAITIRGDILTRWRLVVTESAVLDLCRATQLTNGSTGRAKLKDRIVEEASL